jgi:hypothetical protein
VDSFGYWEGAAHYRREASELTPEQVLALRGLCLIGAPTQLSFDVTSYRITIEDAAGSTVYRAARDGYHDSDEGDVTGIPTVSYDSLRPFLDTFDCAPRHGFWASPPVSEGGAPIRAALPLDMAPGCERVIWLANSAETWLSVSVPGPETIRFVTSSCSSALTLTLTDADGAVLATGALPSGGECASLEYTFDAGGEYLLKVPPGEGKFDLHAVETAAGSSG